MDHASEIVPAIVAGGPFTIYRSKNDSIQIGGQNVSIGVRDNCLLVLNGGSVERVFGPGQWISVNVAPV